MKSCKKKRATFLPYHERLRCYERDKQHLVETMGQLPAVDFAKRLKALQDKWRI